MAAGDDLSGFTVTATRDFPYAGKEVASGDVLNTDGAEVFDDRTLYYFIHAGWATAVPAAP